MMHYFKTMFNSGSIRFKLMFYSLLLILIMLTTSFYTFNNARHELSEFDYMFSNDIFLKELSNNINNINEELLTYLTTRSSDSHESYLRDSDKLRKSVSNMNRNISYDNNELMLYDIANMIDEYLNQGDAAIIAKMGRDVNELSIRYNNSEDISYNINDYIKNLNLSQLHNNTKNYFEISQKLKKLQILNIIIIVVTFLLTVVMTFWFADKTSVPIVSLAKSADEISKGNFEVQNVEVNTNDEIKIMADAFNRMKNNIKNHIYELKYQAEMEAKLNEEKLSNLKMKNLLKNAQLQSLQSQINPHFLFNTLNAGVQLAMMEEAEKTGYFLAKMSELFRYNLRNLDKSVLLQEEINNMYAYVFLLQTRFGDMIKFEFLIEDVSLNINMPALILQPLIENACIHGVGSMELGGKITVKIKSFTNWVKIEIEDNGKGIDDETIKKILSLNLEKTSETKGHTTGIGLDNVIRRLRGFYGKEDVFDIKSELGKGTNIIIKLPNMKEDEISE